MPLSNLDESPLLGFAGYSSHPLLFAGLVSRAPLKARFINVLVSPVLLREFLEFCALPSELALEPLLFVLDVERFRHAQPSMARLLANYIYLTYIAPSAPLRINASGRMRDRIPWPFLPGWEYNPWVFDEILASVGFTLKKHTLLRFERSPVGLASLFASPGFRPEDYVRPLRFDHECDPMAAIAEHFEPDIDVVIWVNDLEFDASGTQLLTNLSRLTDTFRERLLERIAAQFVGDQRARSLCDGYFRLATRIVPLQKQRKIKKTRKLCNFFGDNPHEALLRQQLMAVVPPSSHAPAARAAAELVARKKAELPPQATSNGWSSSDNDNDNDNENDHDDDADEANIDNASTLGYFTERHMRTLDRALSMIGMPNTADSHDSAGSSAGNSPCEPPQRLPTISIFERKKRVDKLREFFGRTTDPAASSLETVHESSAIDDSHLTHAQRQLLVRRRRKLKAILGEQVDECIIGLSPSVSFDEEKEEEFPAAAAAAAAPAGCEEKSLRNMRIRQYSKIREMLGESAPIPNVAPVSPPATDSVDSSSIIGSVSIRSISISISSNNSSSSSSSGSSYEFVPVESSDPIRPVRAQFWMTSSPESQASVVSSEPHSTKRSSLMATLRARKASIIGSIKRATPSTSNLRGGIPGCSNTNSSNFINNSGSSSISNTTGAFLPSRAGARDKVPARSTSIRPLSPLPPISPNNFEASFDRGMALKEVVAVADFISGKSMVPPRTSSARKAPTTAAPAVHTPTNIASSLSRPSAISASTVAAAARPKVTTATTTNSNASAAHSKSCAAVAGPANYSRAHGTAPAASSFAAHSNLASAAGSSSGKTVHWFDSPEVVNYPATPSPDKESFHSAATDVGMSIILRSPSMKKPSIKSPPPIMPLRAPITTTTGFPMLSIHSPPQMSLSHKASVSAVGGRRLEKVLSIVNEQQCDDRKLLLQQTMAAAIPHQQQQQQQLPPLKPSSPLPACTNIVTIRARRSQSFAIRRKLERATVGRKRSNTIGTGKQTGVRTEEDSFKTHEKKKGRRVQSMITSTQLSSLLGNSRISRSRCVTVIPLRLELQRLAARNGQRRQQSRPGNRGYRRSNSELQRLPRRHPFNRRSCVLEYRKKPSVAPARSISNRVRSESCPSRFVAPKKELPIRPAVARYLSEVRSSSSSLPSSYGAYQRISLAQLAPNAQYGRRSLDTQAMARRKYSPYTAGIIRRYASVSAGIRIKEGG
ncbi:hypothetical protein GGH99_001182, partial [Coemansia sp. RSA 1285]